jgi:hypothetical protein
MAPSSSSIAALSASFGIPCCRQTTIGVEQISQSAIQQSSDSKYQWVIRSARQSGQGFAAKQLAPAGLG